MKKGFTIIELIVAISISLLVAGIGVPRVSSYYRQSAFTNDAQIVADCLRDAHNQAASPTTVPAGGTPVATTTVTLLNGPLTGTPSLLCSTANQSTSGTTIGGSNRAVSVSNIQLCAVQVNYGAADSLVTQVSLTESVLRQGGLQYVGITDSGGGLAPTPVPESGLPVTVTLTELHGTETCANPSGSALRATVSLSRFADKVDVAVN